jgi:serine/threonine-protein kinase
MTTPVGLLAALHERYEVVREVGRGGMATVFLAHDKRLDREVAIKVLYTEFAATLSAERFRREVQIATQLGHPHILPIYDYGEADGSLFYVMPFVRGESLRERLRRERQLPVEDALRLTLQVAGALEHAHQRGIVHRDIKPENILLEGGDAVVADFGIARAIGESAGPDTLTQTGITLGTPWYMSPEQALADKTIDGRSDQYALACVLYEMLIGEAPFQGPNAQAIMARHSLAAVPSLRVVRELIPQHVEDTIVRAMAKVPADRFGSMAHFCEALQGLRTTTTRAFAAGRPRRRTALRWAALAAPLVLLGAAVGAWKLREGERRVVSIASLESNPTDVAVLYFDSPPGDSALVPIADGLTESLIEQLARIPVLHVVSRNGVAPFRDGGADLDSISRALDVGTLVAGSIGRSGDSIVVQVRIGDALGTSVETRSFRESVSNPLAARDTLAMRVSQFLQQRLGGQVRLREQRASTSSDEAWVLVRRAERLRRESESAWHAGDAVRAAHLLDGADTLAAAAGALDSRWVEPPVLRGWIAYRQARSTRDRHAADTLLARAVAFADAGLTNDPRSAEALELRATARIIRIQMGLVPVQRDVDRQRELAKADAEAATRENPTQAGAWVLLSYLAYLEQDQDAAYNAAVKALDADAYLAAAPAILWRLYVIAYDRGSFAPAQRYCQEGASRFPDDKLFVLCRLWMLTTSAVPADADEGWRLHRELQRLSAPDAWEYDRREAEITIAAALGRAGLADSARRVLVRARADREIDPQGELAGYEAFVRTLIGDDEEAIRILERYLADHPEHRAGFSSARQWWWDGLRDDPRFVRLAALGG